VVAVSTPGADYTGLAINKAGDTPMLYAIVLADQGHTPPG
jgi:hypothetical protein